MSETTIATDQLAALLATPEVREFGGVPHLITPYGHVVHNLESLLPAPRRIKAGIVAHEVGGLISYVNRFKASTTAIYCAPRDKPSILARIDDNQPGQPSHITHTCRFDCPTTLEWRTWAGADRKAMKQVEFAEFLERNLRDIAEPAGADMLTAVLSFQDTGRAEFRSAIRLNDGRVQFQFVEKEDAGEIKFPERLKVAVPVFEGSPDRYGLAARLRYRITEVGSGPIDELLAEQHTADPVGAGDIVNC